MKQSSPENRRKTAEANLERGAAFRWKRGQTLALLTADLDHGASESFACTGLFVVAVHAPTS